MEDCKMKDYYVTLNGGNCSIIKSTSEFLAKHYAIRLFGLNMSPHIQDSRSYIRPN
ncbi:MAG: hypothetical protein ABH817_01345 [archaeon]